MKQIILLFALSLLRLSIFAQTQDTNYENALLLDVRTEGEYRAEAAPGSLNIPLGELSSRIAELKVNKDDKIVVFCLSGNRSAAAKQVLEAKGYTNVVNGFTCQNVCKSLGLKAVKLSKS